MLLDTLLNNILEGADLRIVLEPDEKIDPSAPPHIEAFDLPHVVIVDGHFWGRTPTVHSRSTPVVCSFCYPSGGRLLCSYTPSNGAGRMIQMDRYKHMWWKPSDRYGLVWDQSYGEDTQKLLDAVRAGRRLKAAMLDKSGVWDINPIHLPMVSKGWFLLRTPMDYYPAWFRSPSWMKDTHEAFSSYFLEKDVATVPFECDAFPSWYAFSPGGVYRGGLSEDELTYEELRIFAEF